MGHQDDIMGFNAKLFHAALAVASLLLPVFRIPFDYELI